MLNGDIYGGVWNDLNENGIWDQGGDVPIPDIELVTPGPVILTRNDDGSTGLLPFGFTFEFYGNNFTDFYINNNGNVTFTEALFEFIPEGFPQDIPIVAPFWADVDTRDAASGEVHLASGISVRGNPFVQVDWLDVGYYSYNTDKLNDFTLYIEDDPDGDIVGFFYRNMEWTTGDMDGEDGFGGSGAQIGFDSGDGVNFLSLARPASADDLVPFNYTEYLFRITEGGTPSQPEPGLSNWTVYIDDNNNGELDDGELSTVTGVDGSYSFLDMPDGSYILREVLQDGWERTAPGGDGSRVVAIAGGDATDQDFGNFYTGEPSEIHGMVWEDTNTDGVRDPGESALVGWTVFLDYNDNGVLDPEEVFDVTDQFGLYSFTELPSGTYTVAEVLQDGWVQTAPPGGTYEVVVGAGEVVNDVDFGNFTMEWIPPLPDDVEYILLGEDYYFDFNSTREDGVFDVYTLDTTAAWLTIDSVTGELTGRPETIDDLQNGPYEITVTADSGIGLQVEHTYQLTIWGHLIELDTRIGHNVVTYRDADGDWVTIRLTGRDSHLRMVRAIAPDSNGAYGYSQRGDMSVIEVDDSNEGTSLAFTVRRNRAFPGTDGVTTMGFLTGATPLGFLNAPLVSFVGEGITMTGASYIKRLRLGNLENGASIVMEGAGPAAGVALQLDRIGADSDILLTPWLASLSAVHWISGRLTALFAGKINMTGSRADELAGDFGANVTMDGADARGYSVSSFSAAGTVGGSVFTLPGAAKTIKAGAWTAGALNATTLDSLRITGNARMGIAGDFGADINLTAQDDKGVSANKISVADSILGSNIGLLGGAKTIKAGAWNGGALDALFVNNLSIVGNRRNGLEGNLTAVVTLNQTGLFAGRWVMRRLSVAADILASTLNFSGNVNSVAAAGIHNSQLYLDYDPGVGDWGTGAFTGAWTLGSLRISGYRDGAPSFVASTVAADFIRSGNYGLVDGDNGGNDFGILFADADSRIRGRTPFESLPWDADGAPNQGYKDFRMARI